MLRAQALSARARGPAPPQHQQTEPASARKPRDHHSPWMMPRKRAQAQPWWPRALGWPNGAIQQLSDELTRRRAGRPTYRAAVPMQLAETRRAGSASKVGRRGARDASPPVTLLVGKGRCNTVHANLKISRATAASNSAASVAPGRSPSCPLRRPWSTSAAAVRTGQAAGSAAPAVPAPHLLWCWRWCWCWSSAHARLAAHVPRPVSRAARMTSAASPR